jgi:hypothetical protein
VAIQLDRDGALRAPANELTCIVITSPAEPGVVIPLDAHVASLLGMTFVEFISTHHASVRCCVSRDDRPFPDTA